MLSILHISDLHFLDKNNDQSNFIRDAFLTDLEALVSRDGRPDGVIFSGDLVHNPDEELSYVGLVDGFIDPLSKVTGVSARNMIFCPGNHDISFKKLRGSLAMERAGLATISSETRAVDAFYNQGKLSEYARNLSSDFFEFAQYVDNEWESPFFKVYEIQGRPVIALNAAFSCSDAGSKEDRGKLFFPIEAWDAAHREAGPDVLATVLHFPITDLNEAHARELQSKIHAASEVLFFGHLHDPLPVNANGVSGVHLALQAGALYQKEDRFKGKRCAVPTFRPFFSHEISYWLKLVREFLHGRSIGVSHKWREAAPQSAMAR